jgi:cephalosporin-C deacetylase
MQFNHFNLTQLLQIQPPPQPADFATFWQQRYDRAMQISPRPRLSHTGEFHPDFEIYDLNYRSTDDFEIGGWILIPKHTVVTRGVVVGHGYGGRSEPDFNLPITEAAFLFPCFRGISRSQRYPISNNPIYHVLHDLDKKDRYILGGCVEDLWLAISALLQLFPAARGHVAYCGISFGGGIGALALPWEPRIQRAHFNVPTFGNHPLRLQLPSEGSAAAVQHFHRAHPELHILETLAYYDAACAAQLIACPVHVAAALCDSVVAPPGQFSIYNALPHQKQLFVLDQGHADYPCRDLQERALLLELTNFFAEL